MTVSLLQLQLISLAILFFFTSTASARPTLLGPGGLIHVPTAYATSGGTISPVRNDSGSTDTVSAFDYAWDGFGELALLKPGKGPTSLSFKYQLTQDKSRGTEDSAATAIGFLDLASASSKAFYAVMSKKAPENPLVLHAGLISRGSMLGDLRPMGGFETPVSRQMLFLGEYDGLQRNINSGFVYQMNENMASFLYLMDIDDAGLNAELFSGFTFRMAF